MAEDRSRLAQELQEVEWAIAAQEALRGTVPEARIEAALAGLRARRESLQARLQGGGAVAQGPGARASGAGAVSVGGNVGGGVQTGGIQAGRIEADNVVSGVQVQGASPTDAAGLAALASAIHAGRIDARQIQAGNVVSGLQFLAGKPPATLHALRQEVAALRAQVQAAVARAEIEPEGDAEDVQDALQKAEGELARPKPDGDRVARQLETASKVLTRSAQVAEAAGKVGLQIVKLAPVAAALYQLARVLIR